MLSYVLTVFTRSKNLHEKYAHATVFSGQKEALKSSSQEIEVLQESISSVSTQLLPSTNHGMCHSHTL